MAKSRIFTKDKNGIITFRLHKGQQKVMASKARFVLALFGKQAGKTSLAPVWLLNEIVKNGPGDYLALAPTVGVFERALLPKLKELFQDILGYEYNETTKVFKRTTYNPDARMKESVRIICVSTATEGAVDSVTAKAIIFDEAGMNSVTTDIWFDLQARATANKARMLLTTTPYNLGWLKTYFYDLWKAGTPGYDVINVRSCDNPSFDMDEYERMRELLPPWKFDMDYNGLFTRPSGLIYSDFVPSYTSCKLKGDTLKLGKINGHLLKPFSVPDSWKKYVGIDFGAVNGCSMFIAEPPNMRGIYIVYREMLGGNDMYEKILGYNEKVRCIGGAPSEENIRQLWGRKKCPVFKPYIQDIEAGILQVTGLLRQNRLFFFDTLTETRRELGSYSREADAAGNPIDSIQDKNKYHHLDALRYGVSYFPQEKPKQKEPDLVEDPTDFEREQNFFNLINKARVYAY